jgi:shikimate kinase
MDWMKIHGLTLFLNTSLDVLVGRIGAELAQRPMFSGKNESEILDKLAQIAENRSIYYSSAKIVWNRSEPNDMLYRVVNQLIA